MKLSIVVFVSFLQKNKHLEMSFSSIVIVSILCLVTPVPFIFKAILLLGFVWFYPRKQEESLAYVLVLGDVGHSPRTYNQCASLIKAGKKVVLFGFVESSLPPCSKGMS